MYKCNEQRTIDTSFDVYKEGRYICIQKKECVELTKKEAEMCYHTLGELLGNTDFQADMKKARARNWN